MPVSMMATSTFTSPEPLPDTVLDSSPSIRLMPVGSDCAWIRRVRSGTTAATPGSALSAATLAGERVAL
jgi:hypothetical protein